MTFLPDIVGQHSVKSQLSFYHDSFLRDGYLPTICFDAPKGEGKTHFMMTLAKELKKEALLVNCGTIKNPTSLINDVLMPAASAAKPITVLLDEIHALNHACQTPLLTVFAPNPDRRNTLSFQNQTMVFDFHQITFMCATTNMEKLVAPLKERMRTFSLEDYTEKDMAEIIVRSCPVVIDPDLLLNEIVKSVRISPRSAVYLADDIKIYCTGQDKNTFDPHDWHAMRKRLNLLPYGLTRQEEKLLKIILDGKAGSKLTYLASVMGKDNRSIQDMERYLMARGLIINDEGNRKITKRGMDYFKNK